MKIGRYTIELKEMTWVQSEEIKAILAGGAKMQGTTMSGFDGSVLLKSKIKTFEFSIDSIKEGDNPVVFSNSWVEGLTQSEGEKLEKAIEEISKKK